MEDTTSNFEEQIKQSKTKEELNLIAEKLGLQIDQRLTVETARSRLLEAYVAIKETADKITKDSAEEVKADDDPIVKFKFTILDINNPEENPMFGFNFLPSGKSVGKGKTIPRWEFMHGTVVEAPFSVYDHLKNLSYTRSRWVSDPSSPMGQKVVKYEQKRFNCDLEMSKEQVLQLNKQKVA
jgi:hypothetical protein